MIRLAALAAMALVLGGCDDAIHDQLFDPPKSSSTRDAERLQANREKMASHFTPDAEIKRIEIERMTFGQGVTVVHDDKRDVTCWVFRDPMQGSSGGMSCIPDWMITRGERTPIGFVPETRP